MRDKIIVGTLGIIPRNLERNMEENESLRKNLKLSNLTQENMGVGEKKRNLDRETESLLIAAQNNAIRTNDIKTRIDKTQQNSKCRLCGNRDETTNHIISECRKLAQKEYKSRHDWVGKVIDWELCKKLKFDRTNNWYMHNPTSVLENETHKLLRDFDIQTYHSISARRPDLIIINKKRTCKIVDFTVSADQRIKLKKWKEGLIPRPCLGIKKLRKMKETFIGIVIGALGTVTEE